MKGSRMELGDAEWTVMNAVWERAPASARDVLEIVEPDTRWAYSTVKTLLAQARRQGRAPRA
jgi:BlaI family penicillinase repressor